jgi:hypothetical protein
MNDVCSVDDDDDNNNSNNGRDSVVSIATRYGLDGPGIECRWGRDFPHPSTPTVGLTQPPTQWVPVLFPGLKRSGRGVDNTPHLVPRLKKECSHTSSPPPGLRGLI